MSSAAKVEDLVDKVNALAAHTLDEPLPDDWFRHILDPAVELEPGFEGGVAIGVEELAQPLPFLPFRTLLVTGTAGAGKSRSVETLAANVNCVITATTYCLPKPERNFK